MLPLEVDVLLLQIAKTKDSKTALMELVFSKLKSVELLLLAQVVYLLSALMEHARKIRRIVSHHFHVNEESICVQMEHVNLLEKIVKNL